MLSFAYTILYVDDVEETLTFYEKAFGFKRKFKTPEGDYGEIMSGETTLAFASHELGASNFKAAYQKSNLDSPFGFELAFTTLDVKAAYETALAHGAIAVEAVVQKPWGQEVGYVKDLNGFLIELCTPISS
ncbi:MAG: VOC family protein [Bacteroidota bacterium]